MNKLPVTPEDLKIATHAGHARQDYARRTGLQHYGRTVVTSAKDIVGCLGELKCAQFFGQPFDPAIGVLTGVDCKLFEVRARDISTGRDLAIRPHDKMRLPHVLVWITPAHTLATIVGWLCGWEGRERAKAAELAAGFDVLWQPKKGCWFIPPPYHSVKSLQDWIDCGAPLHWAPEAYP